MWDRIRAPSRHNVAESTQRLRIDTRHFLRLSSVRSSFRTSSATLRCFDAGYHSVLNSSSPSDRPSPSHGIGTLLIVLPAATREPFSRTYGSSDYIRTSICSVLPRKAAAPDGDLLVKSAVVKPLVCRTVDCWQGDGELIDEQTGAGNERRDVRCHVDCSAPAATEADAKTAAPCGNDADNDVCLKRGSSISLSLPLFASLSRTLHCYVSLSWSVLLLVEQRLPDLSCTQ